MCICWLYQTPICKTTLEGGTKQWIILLDYIIWFSHAHSKHVITHIPYILFYYLHCRIFLLQNSQTHSVPQFLHQKPVEERDVCYGVKDARNDKTARSFHHQVANNIWEDKFFKLYPKMFMKFKLLAKKLLYKYPYDCAKPFYYCTMTLTKVHSD